MGNFKRIDENITLGRDQWIDYIRYNSELGDHVEGWSWSTKNIKAYAIKEIKELSASMNFDNITNEMINFTL